MRKKKYCYFCATPLSEKYYEGRTRLFCTNCNEPLYENPIPATCVVVIDDQNRVLLVKRNMDPGKGLWCLPGGFMELGESPEEGALRELKEETSLCGKIEMLLGVYANKSIQYDTVLITCYLIKEYLENLSPGGDASEALFFHFDKLPEIAFESHKKFINIYYAAYIN